MATKPDYDEKFIFDGKTYLFRFGDVTAQMAMEFRKATGMKLTSFLAEGIELDSIGVIIWLCKRIEGERVTLDQVLAEIDMTKVLEGREKLAEDDAVDTPDQPRSGAHDERRAIAEVADDPELQGVAC